jgi:hypothetical protein
MFAAYRMNAPRIAQELVLKGKKKEAEAMMDKVMAGITRHSYFYDATAYYMVMGYYSIGTESANKKGRVLALDVAKNHREDIDYILSLAEGKRDGMVSDVQRDATIMNIVAQLAKNAGDNATFSEINKQLEMSTQKASQAMNLQNQQPQ